MSFSDGENEEARSFHDQMLRRQSTLMQSYKETGYNLNSFLLLTILVWIPLHIGSSFVLSELETSLDFKECMQFIMFQTLVIGYNKHLTTDTAIYFGSIVTPLLQPLNIFLAIIYTMWLDNLIKKAFSPTYKIASIFLIWFLTVGMTCAFLPTSSIPHSIQTIQNFFSTNSFMVEGDVSYYALLCFAHAGWIYCGSLYLLLETMIEKFGVAANKTAKSFRKTIVGGGKTDKIMAQIVRLSRTEIADIQSNMEVISSSFDRWSSVGRSMSMRRSSLPARELKFIESLSECDIVANEEKSTEQSPEEINFTL